MLGQTVSHYKILEKLGEGGMGVVYKAEDTKLDRIVALKFLPARLAASAEDKARFTQEAKAAASLNHPNVCSIIDIQDLDGQLFMVMEFVDGQTLREKIGNLPQKQAIDIGIQIADGLAAAHERGVVHRDIKPENLMLRKDGICQIMDFGLAKLRTASSKVSRLTKEGSTVGTAGYMSPEQVQGRDVDHRTDIFSLGVVLYELLTGQLPFKGVHETALLYEIVNVDPAPMSAVNAEIHPDLDRIILECLVKEPGDRYQSVAEVGKELRRCKKESTRQRPTRSAQPVRAGLSAASAPLRPSFLRRYGWYALTALLVAAVVLLLVDRRSAGQNPHGPVMRFPINLPLSSPLVGGASTVAVSPDGRYIVYLARSSGSGLLFLRPIDRFEAHPLPGTEEAVDPFFSPDGQWIAFYSFGRLKKVSIFGGVPQLICTIRGFMRGGWWGTDDHIWFGHVNNGIYRVPASGGAPVEVTILDSTQGEISHRFPQPLPDNTTVLFTSKSNSISSFNEAVIATENTATHERKTLVRGGSFARYLPTGHLMFARGSSLYAVPFDVKKAEIMGTPVPVIEGGMLNPLSGSANYGVSDDGMLVYVPQGSVSPDNTRLEVLDRTGKMRPLADTVRAFAEGQVSPDGMKIALSIRAANDDIWVFQRASGMLTRLTFGGGNSAWPVWSPDGRHVLYNSERGRSLGLFWKPWDGSGEEALLGDATGVAGTTPTAFTPDGTTIAYEKEGDVWIMPMTGEGKSIRFLHSPSGENWPAFSPDGKLLAYASSESGRNEIYVTRFPSHEGKWQISTRGGHEPRWRGAGLTYLDGSRIMETVVTVEPNFSFSKPLAIFTCPPNTRRVVDLTPNGKELIIEQGEEATFSATQVNVVLGWLEELRQRFASGAQ